MIKDHHKILGRIFESGYDGRFITLNFEEHENNGILINMKERKKRKGNSLHIILTLNK